MIEERVFRVLVWEDENGWNAHAIELGIVRSSVVQAAALTAVAFAVEAALARGEVPNRHAIGGGHLFNQISAETIHVYFGHTLSLKVRCAPGVSNSQDLFADSTSALDLAGECPATMTQEVD